MITATNYSPTRFRGFIRSTCSNWPTHNAGVPQHPQTREKCSLIVFGAMLGDRREADLLVDLGPGESVSVDPMNTNAELFTMPEVGDPARYGLPAVAVYGNNGARLHLMPLAFWHAANNGAKIRCSFRGRVDALVCVDVWVDFYPGQGWANWETMVTAANPSSPIVQWFAPGEIRLEWANVDGAIVLKSGAKTPATLLRNGESMAHGQARAFVGVVGWQPLTNNDRDAGYAAALGGVVAVEDSAKTPIGLPLPVLGKAFGPPLGFANRLLNQTRDALEGYMPSAIGPASESAVTGAQEDQGYGKGGEIVEPGNLLPSFFASLGLARRPCHWLEASGELLDPAAHPDLVFWSGAPHWHPNVSPDRLGLPRLPTTLETNGWSGPDREHWFANRLWFALSVTASPALYRLAEHQAQLFYFGETVRPGWSTSSSGTARGIGWTALVAANLLRLLNPSPIRTRFVARLLDRIEKVLLPELTPLAAAAIPVAHKFPASDVRSSISPTYPFWFVTWQQAVGAFGLYMLAEQREVQQAKNGAYAAPLRYLAHRFALGVVDFATTEEPGGNIKCWDHVGLRADGQPLAGAEWTHGAGASYSGMFRHWAQPFAFWVAAQFGHERARAHYTRLRGEALDASNSDLCWLPPL